MTSNGSKASAGSLASRNTSLSSILQFEYSTQSIPSASAICLDAAAQRRDLSNAERKALILACIDCVLDIMDKTKKADDMDES